MIFYRFFLYPIALICVLASFPAFAQGSNDARVPSRYFKADVKALTPQSLSSGGNIIQLWGLRENGLISNPKLSYEAVDALAALVSSGPVQCERKGTQGRFILAVCENAQGIDLALAQIQRGYAFVDIENMSADILGKAYVDAERQAYTTQQGVWVDDTPTQEPLISDVMIFVALAGGFFVLFFIAFFALVFYIRVSLKEVVNAQTENTDILSRERALKNKEREIFAMMLDSEIKANKSKIEAYITVYDEMLRGLNTPDKTPIYKKAGDLVQAQPVLERSVFDMNTDKLDILGERLSSHVVHFYARIKSRPEYINLEPDMDIEEAKAIVQKALGRAERMAKLADRLVDSFGRGGHSSEDVSEAA